MRSSHVAATIAAISVGLTAAAALHRRTATRLPAAPATTTSAAAAAPVVVLPEHDGVVLPFVRPVATAPAPAQPATPARCGDNGGRTKAGAPCAARGTAGGRCHHHRLAA
jgi:hypothetical protein